MCSVTQRFVRTLGDIISAASETLSELDLPPQLCSGKA
jgi:hypothetical protein